MTYRKDGCLWIEEDPILENCCGADTVSGYPYCESHCRRAYIGFNPARPRRQEIGAEEIRYRTLTAVEQRAELAHREARPEPKPPQPRPPQFVSPRPWPQEQLDRTLELRAQGLSMQAIANVIGIGKGAVQSKLARMRRREMRERGEVEMFFDG